MLIFRVPSGNVSALLSGGVPPSLVFSRPPESVRTADAVASLEPYTMDPSRNAVIWLTCSRGLDELVPVAGSKPERMESIY